MFSSLSECNYYMTRNMFSWGLCCSIFIFFVVFCRALFPFHHFSFVLIVGSSLITASDLFGIFKLFLNVFSITRDTCCANIVTNPWQVMNVERVGLWLQQTEQSRGHLWHRNSAMINQVMVANIKLLKRWLQLNH